MPDCDVEDQVPDVCCAVAPYVKSLQDALANLGGEYLSPRNGACFLDEIAELAECVVVLVADVRSDAALGGVVAVWVGWLSALLSFAAFVLAYHSGCANG